MSESDSSKNPQFLSIEKEEDKVAGKSSPEKPEISSEKETPAAHEEEKEEKTDDKDTVSAREESGKQIAEDDDGFKTPTSADHKIPEITECPWAPRKPRPPPSKLKRKASPPGACRSLQFDPTAEIESIFRPMTDQENADEQKMKKARREDEE
ncbi:hypothetical protein CDL12_15438 [Handroanthus impetiginosus]|uniref:Uncharacterized protein n=1 Tax=Handroanthus impetiginosus TaxID=429701 RepID=A0A2G9H390_9LAMI|nr:hypothetical protein CDL12_15438 [Handroanthus impetiginosus]